jgi:hypothetical protein
MARDRMSARHADVADPSVTCLFRDCAYFRADGMFAVLLQSGSASHAAICAEIGHPAVPFMI